MGELSGARAMKVTTVRFGTDLWRLLESEAAISGVSVSQYVREAALARAAFAAGSRAGVPGELLASWSATSLADEPRLADHAASTQRLIAALTTSRFAEQREESAALQAQSRQALRRTTKLARGAANDG